MSKARKKKQHIIKNTLSHNTPTAIQIHPKDISYANMNAGDGVVEEEKSVGKKGVLRDVDYEMMANKYLNKIYETKKRVQKPAQIQRIINNVCFILTYS